MQSSIAVMLAAAGVAVAQVATTSEPALSQIQAAAATTLPYSPTSKVQGVAFDHFYQIWLENIVSGLVCSQPTMACSPLRDRTTAPPPAIPTSNTWHCRELS